MTTLGGQRNVVLADPLGRLRMLLATVPALLLAFAADQTAADQAPAAASECSPGHRVELVRWQSARTAETSEPPELQESRWALIEREARQHFGQLPHVAVVQVDQTAPATRACGARIAFVLDSVGQGHDTYRAQQVYRMQAYENDKGVVVVAQSTLGALYGLYEILDSLGFRWPSPGDEVFPATLNWDLIKGDGAIRSPAIRWRGFHTYNHDPDDRFLYWMARNRFNLIGDYRGSSNVRRLLGVYGTNGGHDVLSKLAGSDVVVDGRTLQERHPNWFANGPNPTPAGTHTYKNPCFGEPSFIDFLSRRLAEELASGIYRETDVLHLWPSDQRFLALPATCRRNAEGASDVSELFAFYGAVAHRLPALLKELKVERRIALVTIGYNDTYEVLPEIVEQHIPAMSAGTTDALEVHLVYFPIFRSLATPLVGKGAGALNTFFGKFIEHHLANPRTAVATGVIDYMNLSVNAAIPSPGALHLPNELEVYARAGSSIFAYMHPLKSGWGPGNLVHRLMSVQGFSAGVDTKAVIADHYARNFGEHGEQVAELMRRYERAVSGRSEMMGVGSSLSMLLRIETIWKTPPMDQRAAADATQAFVSGGEFSPPRLRLPTNSPLHYEIPPLSQAIREIAHCRSELQRLATEAGPETRVTRRLAEMGRWVGHAALWYQGLDSLSSWRTAIRIGDTATAEASATSLEAIVRNLKSDTWWGDYVSPVNAAQLVDLLLVNVPGPLNPKGAELVRR